MRRIFFFFWGGGGGGGGGMGGGGGVWEVLPLFFLGGGWLAAGLMVWVGVLRWSPPISLQLSRLYGF